MTKLDITNLLEITKNVYNAFWDPPSLSRLTNDHLQDIITERKLEPDVILFLQSFCALYRLASREIADAYREVVAKLVDKLWEMHMSPTADSLLPTDPASFRFVHLCMESGGQYPFLALYSSAYKESFQLYEAYCNSLNNGGDVRCMSSHLWLYQPKN